MQLANGTTGATGSDGALFGYGNGSNELQIRNRENAALQLRTNDTERMRIDADGNVGIGTDTVLGKFAVTDSGTGTSQTHFFSKVITSTANYSVDVVNINANSAYAYTIYMTIGMAASGIASTATYTIPVTYNGTNNAYKLVIPTHFMESRDEFFQLLIITNNASTTFRIRYVSGSTATANVTMRIDGYAPVTVTEQFSTTTDATVYEHYNGTLITTLANEASTSYVGIGTTNPTASLHVYNKDNTVGAALLTLRYNDSVDGERNVFNITAPEVAGGNNPCIIQSGNAFQFRVDSHDSISIEALEGYVGIGTTNSNNLLSVCYGGAASRSFGAAYGEILELRSASDHAFFSCEANTALKDCGMLMLTQGSDGAVYYNEQHDYLGLAIGGLTDRNADAKLVVKPDGKVGIGRTNPTSLLNIYENSTNTGNTAGLTIENDGTGDAVCQFLLTGQTRWVMGADNSDSDKFKISSSIDLDSDARFVIDTTGNVGIGTTNPTEQLHLYSASAATMFLQGSDGTFIKFQETGYNDTFGIYCDFSGTGDSNRFMITSNNTGADPQEGNHKFLIEQDSGYVGIGSAAPGVKLDVVGTTRTTDQFICHNVNGRFVGSAGNVQLIATNNNVLLRPHGESNTDQVLISTGGYTDFYYGNSVYSRINGGGTSYITNGTTTGCAVGIGTNSPSTSTFHGSGDTCLHIHSQSANRGAGIRCSVDNSSTGGLMIGVGNANDPRIRSINSTGIDFEMGSTVRVEINNTSPYAYKTSGGSWGTLSDERIKTNFREITDPLGKVISLEPKHFEYVNVGVSGHPEGTRTGFIAQEVEEIFPGHISEIDPMISDDQDLIGVSGKVKAIDLDFIPYIVGAIKQMKSEYDQQIADMGVTIANLQAQIDSYH